MLKEKSELATSESRADDEADLFLSEGFSLCTGWATTGYMSLASVSFLGDGEGGALGRSSERLLPL